MILEHHKLGGGMVIQIHEMRVLHHMVIEVTEWNIRTPFAFSSNEDLPRIFTLGRNITPSLPDQLEVSVVVD